MAAVPVHGDLFRIRAALAHARVVADGAAVADGPELVSAARERLPVGRSAHGAAASGSAWAGAERLQCVDHVGDMSKCDRIDRACAVEAGI